VHQLVGGGGGTLVIVKMYCMCKKTFVGFLVYAKSLVGPDSVPGIIYNKIFQIYS
jgi:hypothetical protein